MQTTASSGLLDGYMKFSFNGFSVPFPANAYSFTSLDCQMLLATLPNVQSVYCVRNAMDSTDGATYTIQLRSFTVLPQENNLFYHSGNPPLSAFACDTSSVTNAVGASCTLTDVSIANPPGKFRAPVF